jgi:hypothetical protein
MSRRALLLALVLAYAAGFRLLVLNRPFEYDAEGAGCLNGVLARSYSRFGWSTTHGMPVLSIRPAPGTPIVFYPDHPPLLPLLIFPFYAWFGVGAWQTRLPISLITVAAVYALYRLLSEAGSHRVGLIAAAMFAAVPMTLYFGGFPDVVGMPLIFLVLLTTVGYLRFHRAPAFNTFVLFVAAFAVAGLCDWPAYVIVPVFCGHFVATRPRSEWRWIVWFGVAACALFAALYLYITFATHSPWNWMTPLFARRSGFAGGYSFTFRQWLKAAAADNLTYHTWPLLIASAIWAGTFGFRLRGSQPATTVARLLLMWGGLYVLIGSKALYDHEWAWLPVTPGLVVATALLMDWAIVRSEPHKLATAGWIVALLVAMFASWSAYTTFRRLYPAEAMQAFSPIELGQAIQAAAPDDDDVALLVGGEEAEAQIWFYGDRPVRTRVWSVEDFERRVNDETVDLLFDFDDQPWRATATGIVFPKIFAQDFFRLRSYLLQHYPLTPLPPALVDKFEVFKLRVSVGSGF